MLITIEEGGLGGFGSHVATFLAQQWPPRRQAEIPPADDPRTCSLEQAGVNDMYAVAGLDRAGIVATALTTLGIDTAASAADDEGLASQY